MINIEQLKNGRQLASERAIKIHEALNIPYVTEYQGQIVEMLHGKVLKVITPAQEHSDHTPPSDD